MVHRIIIAALVCATMGSMLFFTGCKRPNGHHPDPEKIAARIGDRLELDETQRARLEEIVIDLEADIVSLHDAEPDPHQEMAEMIRSASLSSIELQQFYQSKREKVDRLAEKVIAHMVDFHDILTPEQREKLAANLEQHREKGRCRFFGH